MAHPNIFERQAHVRQLLDAGTQFTAALKKELAKRYNCSRSAIAADILAFTRPSTIETPYQSAAMRKLIFERDGKVCQYCGDTQAYEYIIEPVIPPALGGVARSYNLVAACQRCNATKRRRVWLPRNLDEITRDRPDWRQKILDLQEK